MLSDVLQDEQEWAGGGCGKYKRLELIMHLGGEGLVTTHYGHKTELPTTTITSFFTFGL
jgi:hypothetical protein